MFIRFIHPKIYTIVFFFNIVTSFHLRVLSLSFLFCYFSYELIFLSFHSTVTLLLYFVKHFFLSFFLSFFDYSIFLSFFRSFFDYSIFLSFFRSFFLSFFLWLFNLSFFLPSFLPFFLSFFRSFFLLQKVFLTLAFSSFSLPIFSSPSLGSSFMLII